MIQITLLMIIQILCFLAGSILIILAGKQDEKTRNPYILIPALMAIGLSAGLLTFVMVSIACIIIFFSPEKINKIIGKADLLLFYSLLVIMMLNQNIILTIIAIFSLLLTLIFMITDKKRLKEVPLISYYAQAYSLTILIIIILSIFIGLLFDGF